METGAGLTPLANHLWQSTVLAMVAWGLTILLRRNRAAVRYGVWLAASVKFLVPLAWLAALGGHFSWRAATASNATAVPIVIEFSQPFRTVGPVAHAVTGAAAGPSFAAILLPIWFCGFGLVVLSWLFHWRRLRRAVREARPIELGLPIRAVSCKERCEPGVFGIFEPVLLLPEGLGERLSPRQVESILSHELCHWRRHDNLTGALHMVVQAMFWFHPLVWWIGSRLLAERERACDEAVLAWHGSPTEYAEGILNICKFCLERPTPCLAGVTGSDLKKRIEFIALNSSPQPLDHRRLALLGLAAGAAILGPLASGAFVASPLLGQSQADGTLQFEVASVKPFVFGSRPENNTITAAHGILRMPQQSLRDCIAWAYNLGKADDVEGPAWLDTEHYDIEGKAADTTSPDELRVMLQNLLRERFHLAQHRKTEQRPVYSLVVGKDGPKLKEVQTEPVKGAFMQTESGTFSIQMVNRISKLTEFLRIFLDHPVLDRTELAGVYDLTLKVEIDDTQMHKLQPGQMFEGFGLTPGVFPAVEQLGLKLVAQKGPVDILLVDHVERPSVN